MTMGISTDGFCCVDVQASREERKLVCVDLSDPAKRYDHARITIVIGAQQKMLKSFLPRILQTSPWHDGRP